LTPQGRQKIEENKGNSASAKGRKGNAIQMLMLALFTAFSLCKPTKYMFVCDLPSVRVSVIQFPTFCFEYLATFQITDTLNFEFLFSGPSVTLIIRHVLQAGTLDYHGLKKKFWPAHENFIKF